LHMAQLIPLPLTVSCFSKIQIGFTFLVPAHPGSPGKRAVKRVCACVYLIKTYSKTPKNKKKRKQKQRRIYLTFAFAERHVTSPGVTL